MYRGEADWTLIGKVKNNPQIQIPIIGNGDVDSGPKAAEMFDRYGVDGVMIGRATYGRPWIFREVKHYLATGEVLPQPSVVRTGRNRQGASAQVARSQRANSCGILEMRRHLSNYFKGLPDFKPHAPEARHVARHPRAVRHARLDRPALGRLRRKRDGSRPAVARPVKRRATLFQHALDIGFVVLDDGLRTHRPRRAAKRSENRPTNG